MSFAAQPCRLLRTREWMISASMMLICCLATTELYGGWKACLSCWLQSQTKGSVYIEKEAAWASETSDYKRSLTVASRLVNSDTKKPLDPIQAFEEWKQDHSIAALNDSLRSGTWQSRKFLVAEYSCPHQAGVQTADYLNSLLMAIVTNRTMLYRYSNFNNWNQAGDNAPSVCEALLERRADWMPRYEDYQDLLPPIQIWNHTPTFDSEALFGSSASFKLFHDGARLVDDISAEPVIVFQKFWYNYNIWRRLIHLQDVYTSRFMSDAFGIEPPLHTHSFVKRLNKEGPVFLYGMLFRQSFDFTPALVESVQFDSVPAASVSDESVFSIGMHSRHHKIEQDGSNVEQEMKCLDKLIKFNSKGRPCLLYLMSDRKTTIDKVALYAVQQHNCTCIHTSNATHVETPRAVSEHGQLAGSGYFFDLVVVSEARSAFASSFRSSSIVPYELMEYGRRVDAWEKWGLREMNDMPLCNLHSGEIIRFVKKQQQQQQQQQRVS